MSGPAVWALRQRSHLCHYGLCRLPRYKSGYRSVSATGVTVMFPCGLTGPMPGWMSHSVAFCEVQFSLADWPCMMEAGEAARLHDGAGAATGAGAGFLSPKRKVRPAVYSQLHFNGFVFEKNQLAGIATQGKRIGKEVLESSPAHSWWHRYCCPPALKPEP